MKNFLIKFYNQPSIVVEAPNWSSAIGPYIGRFSKCEEISGALKMILVEACGIGLVKWSF